MQCRSVNNYLSILHTIIFAQSIKTPTTMKQKHAKILDNICTYIIRNYPKPIEKIQYREINRQVENSTYEHINELIDLHVFKEDTNQKEKTILVDEESFNNMKLKYDGSYFSSRIKKRRMWMYGFSGTILGIVIALFTFFCPSQNCFNNEPCTISLIDNFDGNYNVGFRVEIRGNVSCNKDLFVYLVVNDYHAEWIQPTAGLGKYVDGPFDGYCYLGVIDSPDSINKTYKVFAVITSKAYNEYEHLDKETLVAKSNEIRLIRIN